MKLQATFTDWDLSTVWGIQGAYPYLQDLTTHALTYAAEAHGLIGDGTTTGTTLTQTVNAGSTGVAVTAAPDADYKLASWSDGSAANPRTDTNVTADLNVTAYFGTLASAAREWLGYR
jgi:hypothetical protein